MVRRILTWMTLALLAGPVLPLPAVTAASELPEDGVVIWNEDYTLGEDQSLDGALIVFNGDAILEPGSRVRGDVVVWNGSADADGTVEGNVVASNGDILLGDGAHVQGDVVCTWNCDIEQDENARVDGDIVKGPFLRGLPFGQLAGPRLWLDMPSSDPDPYWLSGPEHLLRWIFRLVRRVATVLVVAALGGLVALIWPEATDRVGGTVFSSPGASLGVGFLTVLAGLALITALAITICLSPAAVLLTLALSAAGLLGWIAVGARVGRRLLRALNAGEVAPLWSASLGTLIITLVTVGLSTALCLAPLGWLLTLIIGCVGLGAVVLTRFGTVAYVPSSRLRPPAASDRPTPSDENLPPATDNEEQEPTHDMEEIN